jgi:hypothetical protein
MNAPLLHTMLGIAQLIVAAALVIARVSGLGGGESPAQDLATIGYSMAAISIVMIVVSLGVLKPRVPGRRPGQSVAAFWADPGVTARATPVWFLLEGAAVVSAVGYFLSGLAVAALMIAVAIGAFWIAGPNSFARE